MHRYCYGRHFMGTGGGRGGGGMYGGLGEGVKREYMGGFGHRVINLACWSSHKGFFCGTKSNLAF